MASINFTGLASGIDTRAVIEAILNAERQPLERLQQRQALFSQRKSAFDELGSKLTAFENSLRSLSSERTFRGRTTSVSDTSVLRASASSGAETGVFEVTVDTLAKAHKIKSDGLSSSDQALVSDGTISIQSGENDAIQIDVSAVEGNNNLGAIRDAINAADAGVSASVLYDGSDYRLIVRAEETGLDNALVITDDTNLNLDGGQPNLVTAADDAVIFVDSLEISSSSNKITGVVPGVTLDLLATTEGGASITLEVAQDNDGVVEAVQSLVSEYNELIQFFNTQFDRESPGPLQGDSIALSIQSRIQSLFTGGAEGIPLGGIRSLSTVGVSFDGKTGEASLDTEVLRDLLDTRFEEVGNLFLKSGSTTDSRIEFLASGFSAVSGEYDVEISQEAQRASVVGGAAIGTLFRDETLTITVGEDEVTVELATDDLIGDVVDKVNTALEGAGIAAFAANDAGRLRITTDAYGSDASLTVVSSRVARDNGNSTEFDTSGKSDIGQDVAGKIGGVDATGLGQILTGADGGDYEGIQLRVTADADDISGTGGDFGSVFYTQGLITNILSSVDELTRFGDGPIDLAKEALQSRSRDIDLDIQRIEDRLASREIQLLRTFTEAERAISALQGQQSTLGGFTVA